MPQEIVIKNRLDFPDSVLLMRELISISKDTFGDHEELNLNDEDYWLEVDEYSFEFVATVHDKVIGFIDFLKINKEGIDILKKGILKEGDLLPYVERSNSMTVDLYCISVVVIPKYRRQGVARMLYDETLSYIKSKGYTISAIYGTLWSDDGERFFERFQPITIGRDKEERRIIKYVPLS